MTTFHRTALAGLFLTLAAPAFAASLDDLARTFEKTCAANAGGSPEFTHSKVEKAFKVKTASGTYSFGGSIDRAGIVGGFGMSKR